MSIKLICAISKNNVIGKENNLPWNIGEDLKRFKELTSNNIIVMGRKTYESIGRPLPNRRNIVLSNNTDLNIENVEVVNSSQKVLDLYKKNIGEEDLYIIGGTYIYDLFLENCEYLYITFIDKEFEGDAYFPKINWQEWELINEVKKFDSVEKIDFYFRNYKRV
tara:strand:+ start:7873 stop:8364 length:492 start_codon:yes stop_codon:yes gene_type:complete